MVVPVDIWHIYKQILLMSIGIKPVGFCRFNETVNGSRSIYPLGCIRKKPVLSSNREWPDGVFGYIVRKGTSAIQQIVLHVWFLVLCICHRSAQSKTFQWFKCIKLAPERIQNRFFQFKTLKSTFMRSKVF